MGALAGMAGRNPIQGGAKRYVLLHCQPHMNIPNERKTMQQQTAPALAIDKSATAVLLMDFQNDMVERVPEAERKTLLESASTVLATARKAGMPVIYIVVGFRKGYPEVSPRNKLFSMVKNAGRLLAGTPGTAVHASVAPLADDVVLTKVRVGAASTTPLETMLRARGITSLVLMGIATSGVVLSTVRWAADMDYTLTVISDGCADFNADTHRVLLENVFPAQGSVVTAQAFKAAVAA
jgi:nicotinamidase-related amidase